MPGLRTEMGHVDHGCRIIRQQADAVAYRHALQALAQFENGQGAKQPYGIKVMGHGTAFSADVTSRPQKCDRGTSDGPPIPR